MGGTRLVTRETFVLQYRSCHEKGVASYFRVSAIQTLFHMRENSVRLQLRCMESVNKALCHACRDMRACGTSEQGIV